MMNRIFTSLWKDYELIDAGNNGKLERWGKVITIRPDRNAYFSPVQSRQQWLDKAHFEFIESSNQAGKWVSLKDNQNKQWKINFKNIQINLQLTKFKHIGIFPEQAINWDYISQNTVDGDRILNLFAYTGVASLVARANAADVFHCDSVKQIISWAKENMLSSDLEGIHWILEDALKFAQREIKRNKKYKGIIMDPPAFGISAKKQRWKIETKFPELLESALKLRDKDGYIIANTYSPRLTTEKISQIAKGLCQNESVDIATLCIKSTTGKILEYGQRTLITDGQ